METHALSGQQNNRIWLTKGRNNKNRINQNQMERNLSTYGNSSTTREIGRYNRKRLSARLLPPKMTSSILCPESSLRADDIKKSNQRVLLQRKCISATESQDTLSIASQSLSGPWFPFVRTHYSYLPLSLAREPLSGLDLRPLYSINCRSIDWQWP